MKSERIKLLSPVFILLIGYLLISNFVHFFFFEGFLSGYISFTEYLPHFFTTLVENNPFNSNVLLVGALKNPIFLTACILFVYPFVKNRTQLKWQNFEYFVWIRRLVLTAAFMLCWELTTYDVNYYLDSAFYVDRALLIFFLVGIYFHPISIPLFLVTAFLFRSQFNYPIGGFPLFDKRVLFDLLALVSTFFICSNYFKIKPLYLFFFVFCLIGGNYFSTFQAKIINSPVGVNWLLENKLNWFFLNSNARGWFTFLDSETLINIAIMLKKWSFPLQIIILVAEFSSILLLFRKNISKLILAIIIAMHLGIFAFGSMLFWKWMGIDLFLLFFLYKAPQDLLNGLFKKEMRLISSVLIFSGFFIFKNYLIGWHDTPFTQFYTYEVTCENGEKYSFSKNSFNPFHQLMQYDQLHYLNREKILKVSGFGYTPNYKLAKTIRSSNWAQLQLIGHQFGKIRFNQTKTIEFERFIKTYFKNYNKRLNNNFLPNYISAPHHLNNSIVGNKYERQSKIVKVEVFFSQYFIEDSVSQLKRKRSVLKIKV